MNKNKIRWKDSISTQNLVYYLSSYCIAYLCIHTYVSYVYVPVDDFLSWPPVCDEKWETAVSEVTHWLLVPAWGQMTLKCFVYTFTSTARLWTKNLKKNLQIVKKKEKKTTKYLK